MENEQNKFFLKSHEMYNLTRNLIKFIIESYLEKPIDVWINEVGTKEKILKTGASGTSKLGYELSEYFILEKEEVDELIDPTICSKLFTDIILKEYFNDRSNKQNNLKTKIEKLLSTKEEIRASIDNMETETLEEELGFGDFIDYNDDENILAEEQKNIDNSDEHDDIAAKFTEIEKQIEILNLEVRTLDKDRKKEIIDKVLNIMNHRNKCYAHRNDNVDPIELGEWADSLIEYIKYDYEIYIVKGKNKILDDYRKKIKKCRDTLFGDESANYFFQGNDYTDTQDLMEAFATNWKDSIICIKAENDLKEFMKKQSDLVYSRFKEASTPFIYLENKRNRVILDQMINNGYTNEVKFLKNFKLFNQIYLFRLLYTMNPNLKKIYWEGVGYDKNEFVDLFLMPILQKRKKVNVRREVKKSILYVFAKYGLLSFYLNATKNGDQSAIEAAINCENAIKKFVDGDLQGENLSELYNLIYGVASYISETSFFVFTHDKDNCIPHKCDDIKDVMYQINNYLNNENDFNKLYKVIVHILTPSLRGWLKHKNNEFIDDYFNKYMRNKNTRTKQVDHLTFVNFISISLDSESKILLGIDEFRLWVVNGFFEVLLEKKSENIVDDISNEYNSIKTLLQDQREKAIFKYHELCLAMSRYHEIGKKLPEIFTEKIKSYKEAANYFNDFMLNSKLLSEQICGIELYTYSGYMFIQEKIQELQQFSLKYCFSDPLLINLVNVCKDYKGFIDKVESEYTNKINSNPEDYVCYRYKEKFNNIINSYGISIAKEHEKLSSIFKERLKAYGLIGVTAAVFIIILKLFSV